MRTFAPTKIFNIFSRSLTSLSVSIFTTYARSPAFNSFKVVMGQIYAAKGQSMPVFYRRSKKRPVRRTSFVRIPRRFPFGHSIAVFFFRRPTSRENLRPGGGRTAFLSRRRDPRTLPFQKIKSHLRNRETRYPRPPVPPVNLFEIKRVPKKDEAAYPSSAKAIGAPPLPKTSASPSQSAIRATGV